MGGVSTTAANHELLWQEKLQILELFFGREHVERFKQKQPRYVFQQFWQTHDRALTTTLVSEHGIRAVAIFGTLEAAECLYEDLRRCGVGTVVFLDNDIRKQGTEWHGVPVVAPSWLQQDANQIDAVIISVQRAQVDDLRAELASLSAPLKLPIFSYYEIVHPSRRPEGETR
jgi:FlaA1/EpsC-like NDP-sugar epimerase